MSSSTRSQLPTVDQVLELPAVRREVAPADWEDRNGHVNVLAYYEFHMQASQAALGAMIDDDYVKRHRQSVFSVEHHVSFFNEALVGHDVSAHFRVLDRSDKVMHAVSILLNRTTGAIVNAAEFLEAHVDLSTRRACPFRLEFAARIDVQLEEHRRLDWEFPLSGSMGVRSKARS